MRWENWFYTLPLRIKALLRRSSVEADLDEELRYHVHRQVEANVADGMPEEDARLAARRSLGSIELRKEECRDALGWRMLDTLLRDGKHAIRRLALDWQFSAGAILILALGIGVNTAVFSIVNNTLFAPRPYADVRRLVNIYQNEVPGPQGVSYPAFLDMQRETAIFSGVSAFELNEGRYQPLGQDDNPGAILSGVFEYASANHLEVHGMRPSLGRWFTAEEERAGEALAVLGHRTWERNFGGSANAIGQTIRVSGALVRIIGVGPANLSSSMSNSVITDLWMPITRMEPQRAAASGTAPGKLLDRRDVLMLQVRARLREGVAIDQARAAMDVLSKRMAADFPDKSPKHGITVLATADVRVHPQTDRVMDILAVALLAVVGVLLAIPCTNLATLLLVRGSARGAEVSVRLALGATRWQIVRHLLMESIVLAFVGAVAGVATAVWGLRYLATIEVPVVLSLQLDYRVLAYTIAVALLCGIGFGLTPALKVTRANLVGFLREQRASGTGALSLARGWFTLKNVLIVGQVAASFLLLMGAALATSMMSATVTQSVGFRPAGLAMLEADPRFAGYDLPHARAVFGELERRIRELPGVERVFVTTGLPPNGQFERQIRVERTGDHEVGGRWATPGYFETLGIPVLSGRGFDERDTALSPQVAVISDSMARQFFGTPNAVGQRFRFADPDAKQFEIVGVVGDIRGLSQVAGEGGGPMLYLSATQADVVPSAIVARTSGDDRALASLMTQEVRRLHPELTIIVAQTMEQHQDAELTPFRIGILALGGVGALGLTLAGIGLYAVVSFAVAQRSSEIGIRIALGASARNLTWLAVREVTILVAVGIAIGSVISGAGLIIARSFAGPIPGANPLAIAVVAAIISLAGAAAAYVPARRAARADPLVAIRHQ